MARVALLIGTGTYSPEFKPLAAMPKNLVALEQVLRHPEMGQFDEVMAVVDPDHATMATQIETWLRDRDKDDFLLLYLAGHGIKDKRRNLYFAATNTRKAKDELVTSTALAAHNIHDWLRFSPAKRQIVVLDCCFSGAFGDLLAADDGSVDVEAALGEAGRVVLTSTSAMDYAFQQRDGELSIYTKYLIQGIQTGAADLDEDGKISVDELHQYTSRKVQEEAPAMVPKIIVMKDQGYRLRIANTPLGDPTVQYRKQVETIVEEDGGTIDEILSRRILRQWQRKLTLTDEQIATIENEVLEPIRHYQSKLQEYREALECIVDHRYPLGDREEKRLQQLQTILGLTSENIVPIRVEVLANLPSPIISEPQVADSSPKRSTLGNQKVEAQPKTQTSRYQVLEDYLKNGDWRAADGETYLLMITTVGKARGEWFSEEDLLNFSSEVLQTIDRLWVKYSNGQFGFSVQKNLYIECCGIPDGKYHKEAWDKFCRTNGWQVKNTSYIAYLDVIFDTSAPMGHLPWVGFGVVGWRGGARLFSRIEDCEA